MTDKNAFLYLKPSSQTRISDMHGRTIKRSQNLRGVLEFARANPCNVVELRALEGEQSGFYGVAFHFEGGAHSYHVWSDWRVLMDWLRSRRTWCGRLSVDSDIFARPDFEPYRKRLAGKAWHIHAR